MKHIWDGVGAFVVDKPAGLLVHNSAWAGPKEETLTERVRTRWPQAVPVHRLDRATSGCVLFAHSSATVARWQDALQAASKRYLALVRGHLRAPVEIDHAIDGKPAHSTAQPLCRSKAMRVSLVLVTLHTGRTHQARRHLKHVSHPILGDVKYGKGEWNRRAREQLHLHRLGLHAWQLQLPSSAGQLQRVTAPLPADMERACRALFDDFASALPLDR